jgi:L-alanine-DL-glutamate epimerase-like enolase superfamily enzyme
VKIASVEPMHVNWGEQNKSWVRRSAWVRIVTDAGLIGYGEASPMDGGSASLQLIAAFRSTLLGAEPLDIRILQQRLFHHHIKTGPDGALAAALAAVDIALWDIKGQALGQPIHQLLGGAWRRQLPFYASVGGNAERTPDEACRAVEKWMAQKPAMVKIRFDPDKTVRDRDIPGDIAKARAVRKLVGDGFPLAFDGNNGYSTHGAIRVGRALEELGFEWFEEPVQSYHTHSFEKVADALDIAVAAGEQEYTLQGVKRLINAGVDIVQPDIVKTGGFTGLSDMAALARAYGVDMVPHQTQPTIGHVANMHFVAALPHAHYPVECNELAGAMAVGFVNPVLPQDGIFTLPEGPGLGLKYNAAELAQRIEPWRG